MAQHEIGVIAGGINGVSYKYWWSERMAIQTDLAVGLTAAPAAMYVQGQLLGTVTNPQYDFTINPNVLFHMPFSDVAHFYTGGGVNLGMVSDMANTAPERILGKFGINAVAGIGFFVSNQVSLSVDFRPGYGLGFANSNAVFVHFFDWKLGLAVRYCL